MRSSRFFTALAVLALGVLASAAPAQLANSFIYWRQTQSFPNPSNHYKYPIRRTSAQFQTFPNETGNPTARSTPYPGGRQFMCDYTLDPALFGFIPGTTLPLTVGLMISETPTAPSVLLTLFFGPEFQERADYRWASNNSDAFLSFQSLDPVANVRRVYRYNGSKAALFSATFQPFDQTDIFPVFPNPPRLVLVTSFSADSFTNDWNSNGTKLMFSTPAPFGFLTRIRDTAAATTTTVNDPAVSGFSLRNPVFAPGAPDIAYAVAETPGGQRGIATFNVVTKAFRWMLLEGGVGNARIWNFTSPQVSPDGTTLAFTLSRITKIGTRTGPAPSLVIMPITGIAPTILWTQGLNLGSNPFEVTAWVPAP